MRGYGEYARVTGGKQISSNRGNLCKSVADKGLFASDKQHALRKSNVPGT
jgi:hypothetical protein